MRFSHILPFLFFAGSTTAMFAQAPVPVIRAHTTHMRILDGDDLREGAIVPGLRPDVYVCHKSAMPRRVVYYTDADSIAFTVHPGDSYDFAVLLNGQDSCFQRIATLNPTRVTYTGKAGAAADTIPFVLGPNNAVHVRGSINGSDTLDLIFDTGASLGVLSEEGRKKGARCHPGNKNSYGLAGVRIDGSPMIEIDYHSRLKADGVIGYNVFEDRIVTVNYDRHIIVVHRDDYSIPQGYTALPMRWRGDAMFVDATLRFGNRTRSGLFLFDLGSRWAVSVTKGFAAANRLYDAAPVVGSSTARGVNGNPIMSQTIIVPQLQLGSQTLHEVPAELEQPSEREGLSFNIIGNDVLKRFNVILDYRNSVIYLQQNSLAGTPYFRPLGLMVLIAASAAILLAGILLAVALRRRKRRRFKHKTVSGD